MKFKKLVSAVVCTVMACAFAMSAFAANEKQIKAAQDYLASRGISYDISEPEVQYILDTFGSAAAAESVADGIIADIKANPNNAESIINTALAPYGISVSGVQVSISDNKVSGTGTITVNGVSKAVSASYTVSSTASADEHPDIAANKDENGNWHVDEDTAAAASTVTSGTAASGVIKATGDFSGVVLVAGVLVVASVLGLAVRKNHNVG